MRRGRRSLSEEERRLWTTIAETVTPLRSTRRSKPDTEPAPPPPAAPPVAPAAKGPASAPPAPPPAAILPAPIRRPAHPALHPIEKPVKRRIAKGRVAIEARIDLHDKTQMVAHFALLAFLRSAQAEGLRHVLVITGRGASFGSTGAIRRALPFWFETGEFRQLVSGFEPAERVHGGEGAFYVRVRRR